jgi:hypothetical protein
MASDTTVTPSGEAASRKSYSADVRIRLEAKCGVLYPSQVAHDRLIFLEPQTLEPSSARLIISVDDFVRESIVEILPHESPSEWIPIRTLSSR